ncbi:hypothetical protein BBD41_19840 [Paenibacillus ihbetae]|uniref:Uncharacterized protein n=1 Tax=Paenibacillus ihbetae TaxID=1870820 RepID=A0A1B2E3R7_9BACL|nr:hypothetical protein BBD41_19840 [Paenibacillus ihbetae]
MSLNADPKAPARPFVSGTGAFFRTGKPAWEKPGGGRKPKTTGTFGFWNVMMFSRRADSRASFPAVGLRFAPGGYNPSNKGNNAGGTFAAFVSIWKTTKITLWK